MAKKFSAEDVTKLVNSVNEFIKKLNICTGYSEGKVSEITDFVYSVDYIKKCGQTIRGEFACGKAFTYGDDYLRAYFKLFKAFILQFDCMDGINMCVSVSDTYVPILLKHIDSLNRNIDGFKWIMLNNAVKSEIEDSYFYLSKFMKSDERKAVCDVYKQVQQILKLKDYELLQRYQKDCELWLSYVSQIYKTKAPKKSSSFNELMTVCDAFKSFHTDVNVIDSEILRYDGAIRQCIRELTTISRYDQLKKMPVSEINKDKNGYRISTLVENGLDTVADVFDTPVGVIATFKGISYEQATNIKNKVDDMYDMLISSNAGLKLSYDDQNTGSTKLVKLIYNAKRYLSFADRFKKLSSFEVSAVKNAYKTLSKFKHTLYWLFYTVDERQELIDAYKLLEDLNNGPYLRLEKELDTYTLNRCSDLDDTLCWDEFKDHSISYYNLIEAFVPGVFDEDDSYGLPDELADAINNEECFLDGLRCDLRRYQLWGVKFILHQLRVLLGDEMGLGKTIQAIAVMISLRNTGDTHFIVVCPASVLINWCREIRKHSDLKAYPAHGAMRDEMVEIWKRSGGVLVTTYETYGKLAIYNTDNVGIVIVDEAHYIKNDEAKRSIRIRNLCNQVDRVLFMTGTPLENNVKEMLSLIRCLNKSVANELSTHIDISQSKQFRDIASKVYFRRKQCDVNKELPEKIEDIVWCELSPAECMAYAMAGIFSLNPFMPMRRVSWMMEDPEMSCKANALREIVSNAVADKRKVIVFSFFKDTIQKVKMMYGDHCTDIIDGSISPDKRQAIIDDFTNDDNKYVLVSQIQAGGTGLNIQAASVVVMCEPQIKPSIEDQAIARAHRMGQSRNVLVYRLCCENSIDEFMLALLERKREQFNEFADESVAGIDDVEITENDIKLLVKQEIERIKAQKWV